MIIVNQYSSTAKPRPHLVVIPHSDFPPLEATAHRPAIEWYADPSRIAVAGMAGWLRASSTGLFSICPTCLPNDGLDPSSLRQSTSKSHRLPEALTLHKYSAITLFRSSSHQHSSFTTNDLTTHDLRITTHQSPRLHNPSRRSNPSPSHTTISQNGRTQTRSSALARSPPQLARLGNPQPVGYPQQGDECRPPRKGSRASPAEPPIDRSVPPLPTIPSPSPLRS